MLDVNKIKDVLALGAPTGANKSLADLFMDQIITLGQIVKDMRLPGEEVCDLSLLILFSFFIPSLRITSSEFSGSSTSLEPPIRASFP